MSWWCRMFRISCCLLPLLLAIQIRPTRPAAQSIGPIARGSVAFHYSARLSARELQWLARFRLVVPGDILPRDQVRAFQEAGSRLIFYRWLTGVYLDPGRKYSSRSWESLVSRHRSRWLLNPARPDPGPNRTGRAYYYDPSDPQFAKAWLRWINGTFKASGYDGVFFDLVGSLYVPERLRQAYTRRHPDIPYDQALSGLLRSLKRERPAPLIFTNQGYRTPEVYLPLADYDLSESLMTSYAGGDLINVYVEGEGLVKERETYYRPWGELKAIIDSIDADVKRYNPAVRLFHLNYVNSLYRPTGRTVVTGGAEYPVFRKEVDRPAIYYGYAAARLWGHESYSPSEGVRFARDEIYFTDLGKPLGESFEERDGLILRYYQQGVVVVNPSDTPMTASLESPFIPPEVTGLLDCYQGASVAGLTVTVRPTLSSASGRAYPAGRVYLYAR